jgi:hypothetical protein
VCVYVPLTISLKMFSLSLILLPHRVVELAVIVLLESGDCLTLDDWPAPLLLLLLLSTVQLESKH